MSPRTPRSKTTCGVASSENRDPLVKDSAPKQALRPALVTTPEFKEETIISAACLLSWTL
jgi:hypothetical protein